MLKKLKLKKATKKLLRSLLLVFIILALFVIFGLPAIIQRVIGPEAIVAWVSGELRQRLNRQFIIADAGFDFIRGLDLRGVRVSEKPDFKAGIFLEAERLFFKPKIYKLLLGQVDIEEVVLRDIKAHLAREQEGLWNVSEFFKKDRPQALELEPRPKRLLAIALHINQIKVDEGRFILNDALKKIPAIELRGIDLDVRRFSLDEPFKARISFKAQLDFAEESSPFLARLFNDRSLELSFDGRVNLGDGDPASMSAVFDKFEVAASSLPAGQAGWQIRALGELHHFVWPSMKLEAGVVAQFDDYRLDLSSESLSLDGLMGCDLKLIPQADGLSQDFDLHLDAKNLGAKFGKYFDKKQDINLTADTAGHWQENHFSGDLALQISTAPVGGVGLWELEGGKEGAWRLKISSGTFYPHGFLSLVPLFEPYNLSAGTLRVEEFGFSRHQNAWELNVKQAALRKGFLKKPNASIKFLEAALEELRLASRDSKRDISFKGALQAKLADTPYLQAQEFLADVDLRGLGDGNNRANGVIRVHLNSGGLRQIPELVTIVPFFKFLIKPLMIMEDLNTWRILKLDKNTDFSSIPMEAFESQYTFTDGKMDITHLAMKGPLSSIQTKGSVDFPHDQTNILVTIAVPRSKVRWKFADTLIDETGTLHLSLKVKGPVKNPAVYTVLTGKNKESTTDFDSQHWGELKKKTKDFFKRIFR